MSKTYNRLYFIGGKGRSFIHFFYKLSLFIFLSNIIISSVPAQENYIVRGVKFTGNESLGKDYLIENLAIKEVSYFEQLVTSNEPFLYHRDLVQLDVERLKTIYQSEGFLGITAKLDQAEINNKRETVKVTFNIEEGEPVRVDSVFFKFTDSENSSFNDSLSELIIEELELVPGKRFRDKSLEFDIETIITFLQNLGYAYATVDYDLRVKPSELLTEIEYSISKGPLCQFGETQIAGNDYYSEKYILNQLTYQEGEQYSKSELKESRQYLYDLHVFRVVSIVPQRNTQTQQNPIPVKIYIEEAPRLSTRFGVGYGTEDKFRAFLDLNHLGLFGQARRINLFLKHSALEPYSASLKWIQPRFLTRKSSITLNPFIHKKSEPGYETRTFGINIPLRYEHNDLWSSSITYFLEGVEQTVEEGDAELPDFEDDKFPYNKSGILFHSIFENSQPEFSPDQGIRASLGFKLDGYIFGGTFNYTTIWGDFRTYNNLGPAVLAFRIMAGAIHSSDTSEFIPVEDRFYSGGTNSIRGWSRADLGPKRESGTPLGGKSIFESSLELRYFLFWKLSVVGFIDVGNIWTESYTYKINELAYAAGGGLRFETPIGPVRLDVGFPLWNEKKSPQFFLSVGQAF